MRRILIIAFSFVCVITLLYVGNNIYESKTLKTFKDDNIKEIKIKIFKR